MRTPEQKRKHAEYMRAYMADPARRAAKRERDRVYNEAHREEARQRAKAWSTAHREHVLAAAKARHERTKVLIGRPRGEAHRLWKGEGVGYHALHLWLASNYGKPSRCEHCDTTTAKRFEWANVDHQYRRAREDWMRLCTSCHRRHDLDHGLVRLQWPFLPKPQR